MRAISNPFKPGRPVDPEYFGGRAKELETFSKYLTYSIKGNPHNIAVLGERGIGKSSLLRKFGQIASEENNCLAVRRELDASVDSLQALTNFMLEALKSEGSSFHSGSRKAVDRVVNFFSNYKVGISVFGHGFSIERLERTAVIQDYFAKELTHVWEGVRTGTDGIVFLVDESERLQEINGAWSFLRSVFTRLSEGNAGYMLVVSGKLGLFRGIKEIFSPMERFFTPLEVKPMTREEVAEALARPLELSLKARVDDETVRMVTRYSGGHPYIVQTFGMYIFEEMVAHARKNTDVRLVETVLPRVMSRLTNQIFNDRFEQTSRLERKALLAVSQLAPKAAEGVTPQQIKQLTKEKGIRTIISRLVEKDCLIKMGRGRYSLFTPLFAEYVKARMSQ